MNQYFISFSFTYFPETKSDKVGYIIYNTPEEMIKPFYINNYVLNWIMQNDPIILKYGTDVVGVHNLEIKNINKL